MDWKKQQTKCEKCNGFGYTASDAKHQDGRGPHAWAARCECQPRTMEEMKEAAEQEDNHSNPEFTGAARRPRAT